MAAFFGHALTSLHFGDTMIIGMAYIMNKLVLARLFDA